MSRLEIRLLGGFDVRLDGEPATGFESATTRALLARLAAEAGHVVPRRQLAELLWPERPEGKALANLRHSLSVVRRAIGDNHTDHPAVTSPGSGVMLDPTADVWVDTVELLALARTPATEAGSVGAWKRATELWRGPFLDGFDGRMSHEWDGWVRTHAAAIDAATGHACGELAEHHAAAGDWDAALSALATWVHVDPWNEPAHRRLFRVLAMSGDRSGALAAADAFRTRIEAELTTELTSETEAVIDAIRSGRLPEIATADPPLSRRRPGATTLPECVGRDDELEVLSERLEQAVNGCGGIVSVTGPAGSGKSLLMRTFALAVQHQREGVLVTFGSGNAFHGGGDPYLPFRRILGTLTGDLDQDWREGMLTPSGARRIWKSVPAVVDALAAHGHDLLGPIVDPALVQRHLAGDHPNGLGLRPIAGHGRSGAAVVDQLTRVLVEVGARTPLLILIDDLHWADAGTLDVLHHLSNRMAGARLLVLCGYRPPELLGDGEVPDRVGALMAEVGSHSPAPCQIVLTGERAFVDAFLDSRPNCFDEDFRSRLFSATHGHALFTVELVRAMEQRGDIVQDGAGRWIAGPEVDWRELPPRIEATIGARLAELPSEVLHDLRVASVQGDSFTTELVAAVRNVDADDVGRRMGGISNPPLSIIEPGDVTQIARRDRTRYRFRHSLFRRRLYDRIPLPERRALHRATGELLEAMNETGSGRLAGELAHHFDAAGIADKAAEHHRRAGLSAMRAGGLSDADAHLSRALDLLARRSGSTDDQRSLAVLVPLGSCRQAVHGYSAEPTRAVYERIRRIVSTGSPTPGVIEAMGALITFDGLLGRYRPAAAMADRLVKMAQEWSLPPVGAVAHMQAGWLRLMMGDLEAAHRHLDMAITTYDPQWEPALIDSVGADVLATALAWQSIVLWNLGRFDEADTMADRAIERAQQIHHPFTMVFALSIGGCLLSNLAADGVEVLTTANEVERIAQEHDFPFYVGAGRIHGGCGLALTGELDAGIESMIEGRAQWRELGTVAFEVWTGATLARFLVQAGRFDEAAGLLRQLDASEEGIAAPELLLARGELAWSQGDVDSALGLLERSLDHAQSARAAGMGLIVAIRLAELHLAEGRSDSAAAVLAGSLSRVDGGRSGGPRALAEAIVTEVEESIS